MLQFIRCLVVIITGFAFSTAWSAPWAVVTNIGTGGDSSDPGFESESIYTLDLAITPPQVYGPFLEGELVTVDSGTGTPTYGQYLLDVVSIPGTNDVLVSNFFGTIIYRINLDNPISPVLVGSVTLDDGVNTLHPEDISVSPDGKLAIVSDGGAAAQIAFIDLDTLSLKSLFYLFLGIPFDPASPPAVLPPLLNAQAVEIAADNQTVVMADYWGGRVVYGKINASQDGLESVNQIHLCPNWDDGTATCGVDDYQSNPVNVSISPDGKTVLVPDPFWGLVSVLQITGPGQVQPGVPFQLWGFPDTHADYLLNRDASGQPSRGAAQSIDFTSNGQRAYLLQVATSNYSGNAGVGWTPVDLPDQLSWIKIDGPGQVSVGGVWVAELLSNAVSALFGVDTIAINGNYAYSGNPYQNGDPARNVSRVNLTTFATSMVETNSSFPIAIDFLPSKFPWSMFVPAITNSP